MTLSDLDKSLLSRCIDRQSRAWEDLIDRYLGLVFHVINHTAQCRSIRLTAEDREDLAAEVFTAIISDDFAILRNFRGECSLATYLTVIARRIVVHDVIRRKSAAQLGEVAAGAATEKVEKADHEPLPEQRISDREQIDRLLQGLDGAEAEVVRLYHLEGKSYQQISDNVGMPVNSIGPTLSRARAKMREAGADQAQN